MIIKVRIKNHYGKDFIYPLDHIKAIEALTGAKTLIPRHIKALKELGIEFKQEAVDI